MHEFQIDQLARFVVEAQFSDIPESAMRLLTRNVLDSIACALGALDGEMIPAIRAHAGEFSSARGTTIIGGGRSSVDQATFVNSVLVRYPDLLDTYLTPGGLCHPADNFGAILAMAEYAQASGADFLLALAVAYEVQCRFCAQVPLMARGLNHALPLAMSVAAGASKVLGLNVEQTAAAIAAAGVDNVSLAGVHAEPVSNWKGISPAVTAMRAVYTTLLARRGITGPRTLIDGPHGLVQLLDQPIDLRLDDRALTAVEQTYLKQYCALIHGQVVIDATLALREQHRLKTEDIDRVTLDVFATAYDIAGGGAYGDKSRPWTKEQADYDLKYLTAVALLDGQVGPRQLENVRVRRDDVQDLLQRVEVRPDPGLTAAYPQRTAARVCITLRTGDELTCEKDDFEGSPTRPMSWQRVVDKFHGLAAPHVDEGLRAAIIDAVAALPDRPVAKLTARLGSVTGPQ